MFEGVKREIDQIREILFPRVVDRDGESVMMSSMCNGSNEMIIKPRLFRAEVIVVFRALRHLDDINASAGQAVHPLAGLPFGPELNFQLSHETRQERRERFDECRVTAWRGQYGSRNEQTGSGDPVGLGESTEQFDNPQRSAHVSDGCHPAVGEGGEVFHHLAWNPPEIGNPRHAIKVNAN